MGMFKKAIREEIKLKFAITGDSGTGKTYSALAVATHLGKRIAFIDTENGGSKYYADLFDFDLLELDSFSPAKYIEAIDVAVRQGYDVIVIDSLSHARKWAIAEAGKSSGLTGWARVKPLEQKLIHKITHCKQAHIIATMREKSVWATEEYTGKDGRSKQAPVKLGTEAIQIPGIEYEFALVGKITHDHVLTVTKTRLVSLVDKSYLHPGQELAEDILHELNRKDVIEPPPKTEEVKASTKPKAPAPKASAPKVSQPREVTTTNETVSNKDADERVKEEDVDTAEFRDNYMNKTGQRCKVLGWSGSDGKAFLKSFYDVTSRQLLSNTQLKGFCEVIESLDPKATFVKEAKEIIRKHGYKPEFIEQTLMSKFGVSSVEKLNIVNLFDVTANGDGENNFFNIDHEQESETQPEDGDADIFQL